MVDSAATGVKTTAVSALVAAEVVSVLGTRMTYLALPWFVLVTTGSPGKMTLVLAAEIAPMAILGIPSGTLVERLGSRTTMLVADFARAPILASIPLLHAADALTFPLLLGLVALLVDWTRRFPVVSVEDPLAEDDAEGMAAFMRAVGGRIQVEGDLELAMRLALAAMAPD